jgi:L-lactate dehydrogenase complex protein LldG
VTARDDVLARIRTALGRPGQVMAGDGGGPDEPAVPRDYRIRSELRGADLLARLAERLRDYDAAVRTVPPEGVAYAVRAALVDREARRIVVPPGLDVPGLDVAGLTTAGIDIVEDEGCSAAELDRFDGVLTTAAVAIAETGTIVLDGSPGQGRRALTLVPDYHLCVLREGQVVGLVPEALARLIPERPLTWISGPSATSDIELERVQGVHGPRTLEVILVTAAGTAY